MAAQIKEVVVDTDLVEFQYLSPDRGECLFGGCLRRDESLFGTVLGSRQRLPIEFAVRTNRKPIEHDDRRRKHVLGKLVFQEAV